MNIRVPKVNFKLVGQLFENGTSVILGSGEYNIDVLVSPVHTKVTHQTDVIARWLKQGINGVISGLSCENIKL